MGAGRGRGGMGSSKEETQAGTCVNWVSVKTRPKNTISEGDRHATGAGRVS